MYGVSLMEALEECIDISVNPGKSIRMLGNGGWGIEYRVRILEKRVCKNNREFQNYILPKYKSLLKIEMNTNCDSTCTGILAEPSLLHSIQTNLFIFYQNKHQSHFHKDTMRNSRQ